MVFIFYFLFCSSSQNLKEDGDDNQIEKEMVLENEKEMVIEEATKDQDIKKEENIIEELKDSIVNVKDESNLKDQFVADFNETLSKEELKDENKEEIKEDLKEENRLLGD